MIKSEEKSLHYRTVYKILPKFARQLKKEGVISDWDRKQFKIEVARARNWEPMKVNPDLTLHVPGRGKVVIEVVNPNRDPKRFVGELVYPHILGDRREIQAAMFWVLHSKKRKSTRAMSQQSPLDKVLKKAIPAAVFYWRASDLEEIDRNFNHLYRVFKKAVVDYKKNGKFSFETS